MNDDDFIDKFFSKVYSKLKEDTKPILLFFFSIAFILRVLALRNLNYSPDAVNHAIRPYGIFDSGKLVIWDQSTSLWYYVQGVFYKIFGPTTIASRFATLIFGSLLVLLMYFFVKRVFKSEKAALASSFLIAISPLLIKSTSSEMDITMGFLIVLSAYFLFGYFDSRAKKDLLLSALVMGIAIMIKFYALVFALAFLIFLIYWQWTSNKDMMKRIRAKKILKNVLLFSAIIFILLIPTFTHNYLLYEDKGYVDYLFTQFSGIGVDKSEEMYSWAAGWNEPLDIKGFFLGHYKSYSDSALPGGIHILGLILLEDGPFIFLLGLFGLFLMFKKYRKYFWFFILALLPPLIVLGSASSMIKHLVWFIILLAAPAGLSIEYLLHKFKKLKLKHIIIILLILNLLFLSFATPNRNIYVQSAMPNIKSHSIIKELPDNSLVVADSRIYRGKIHWVLLGKNYVEARYFFDIAKELNAIGAKQNIPVYYIECVPDDCGWGTVKNQPDFNDSMEKITKWFANLSYHTEEVYGLNSDKKGAFPLLSGKQPIYRIYKLNLALNPEILKAVEQTHYNWFLLNIGYDRSIAPMYDDYETRGLGTALKGFAWAIHYFELLLVFLSIFYIFYLFIKDT